MAQNLSADSGSELAAADLERELDRLSVEQALRDFEIANARAIDLTQRLIDLSHEVTDLRAQLVATQEALSVARGENAAIRASATYRVAEITTKIRNRLRR